MRPQDPTADAATLDAARAGRRDAQAALLRALQDPWYRMCLSQLGGDAELARDATQETAVRFLRQLPGFRGDSQLRTWSLGIALNVAREARRRASRERATGDDASRLDGPRCAGELASSSPFGRAASAEERDRLHATLAELPVRQREAIVLRFFEDLSVEEAARAMGCAAGTVKATVHQALRSLRHRLERSRT